MEHKDLNELYFLYNPDNPDETGRREVILRYIPDKLSYSYSPNFSPQDLLGRLSPVMVYTGGSPKTYSFSISYHEDMVTGAYDNLVELVDKVKSLSYPEKSGGIIKMPRVYFQLGEISGYGLVKTDVSWKKPFRLPEGNYTLVDISFNITVEEIMVSPNFEYVEFDTGAPRLSYVYKINSRLLDIEAGDLRDSIYAFGQKKSINFNTSISDLVGFSETDPNVISNNLTRSLKEFEFQRGRLDKIYGIFLGIDSDIDDVNSFDPILGLTNKTVIVDTFGDGSGDNLIYNLKRDFKDYLDEYYENNRSMTEEEYTLILYDVYNVLNNLEELADEVVKYGKSS